MAFHRFGLSVAFVLFFAGFQIEKSALAEEVASSVQPLLRVVDLNVGEESTVKLCDGSQVQLKLISLKEHRDRIRQAVRSIDLKITINGVEHSFSAGPYTPPETRGPVQIDCTVTKGYNKNGTPAFWGLDKDARFRLWPAGSPLLHPGSMIWPVKQKWHAADIAFDNEPVDGGRNVKVFTYYHSGIDIGASEGLVEVIAATDAVVVQRGMELLDGHGKGSPTAPRSDVVYLLDSRGWYYRYSHLKEIDPQVKVGAKLKQGARIGLVGKEGASGGWSHLHFEVMSRQPSGKWGTQAACAFLREAAIRDQNLKVIAMARPSSFVIAGDEVLLDGSRSWSASGKFQSVEWLFDDGSVEKGFKVKRLYPRPGIYHETLKVVSSTGDVDYNFAVVHVLDPDDLKHYSPDVNTNYFPTQGIKPGTPVTFKVRSFRFKGGEETWNFGDGTSEKKTRSDQKLKPLAKNGYVEIVHQFAKKGDYIVKVRRTNDKGTTSYSKLHVRVE